MFKIQQANSRNYEDLLLNFLVNEFDQDVASNLANNAESECGDVYDVRDDATADGSLISMPYNPSKDLPSAKTQFSIICGRSVSRNGASESLTHFFGVISLDCFPSRPPHATQPW